jgi:rubrerythrin
MEIIRAFEALRKLELRVQDLYTHYHKLFSEDREAAGLFFELSLEEKSHADLIDYQLRIIKKNKLLFSDIEFDMEALNQFIAKIESRISSKKPVSLKEALEFGIAL